MEVLVFWETNQRSMTTYLSNLLPRVRQFSQSLDKKELLVDQPWVRIDEQGNKEQYIFERDGKLILSLNGQVQYGNWKYLPAAKSLLIDRQGGSLLLNQDFFNEGICVLKLDGFKDQPWLLINQRVVPDMDVQRYLLSLIDPPTAIQGSTSDVAYEEDSPEMVKKSQIMFGVMVILIALIILLAYLTGNFPN